MNFEIYKVPNNELDGSEEMLESFNVLGEAMEYAYNECNNIGCDVWVIQASDSNGYEKVIAML